ncbi:uncharacterized protein LOC130371861 [Gadus chalcogrammus]|uniref:uncharacterized protein LOC130371861 n=1 Tax=Gadus chalcogrammus TaxID=1042646 RepID=UPI0024C49E0A|nr:uncharacterized protein LOC130371861 [Gadus chalcogrammus]
MSLHHTSTVFHGIPPIPDQATVVKTGYLLKSPPYSLLRRETFWRRRFFVLYKSNEQDYRLKYFNSEDQKDRALGEIDLKQLRAMLVSPGGHPSWSWVQKNVNCNPSCVLYINTSAREYFLVGANSSDVNDWLIALSNPGFAEQSLCEVVDFNTETLMKSSWKLQSVSEPAAYKDASWMGQLPRQSSEPVDPIYDYPKAYRDKQLVKEPLYVAMDEVDDRLTGSVPQAWDKLGTITRQHFSKAVSMEAPDNSLLNPDQRDVVVLQADLKEHLSLSEVDGRLSVSGWTGQPLGLFREGDQFLALNDLLTCSMVEFHAYLSRSLKKQVKVTILRHLKVPIHRRHSLPHTL